MQTSQDLDKQPKAKKQSLCKLYQLWVLYKSYLRISTAGKHIGIIRNNLKQTKVLMQGKLIAVVYTLLTY